MVQRPESQVLPRLLSGGYDDAFSDLALIAGGKVYRVVRRRLGSIRDVLVKETPFGCSMPILFMERGGRRFFVLPRHGERDYRVTAPFVNYRANVWALKELGVRRIVAWTGPATLTAELGIGDYVLPDDVLDLTRNRPTTFFENRGIGLLRQRPVFCPILRRELEATLRAAERPPSGDAEVYAVCEGPRFETLAEVRMLQTLGATLVGMTLAPEVFLARELEMCYHPIAYVTAYAEGVGRIDDAARRLQVDEALASMPEIVGELLDRLSGAAYACSCQDAMLRYKQRGTIGDDFREWIE